MNLQIGIVIITITLAALGAWLVPALRGGRRKADELESALDQLANGGPEYEFLMIQPKYSPNKFVQFSRYEFAGEMSGLELAFPDADWSADYFRKVVSLAAADRLKYEILEQDGTVTRFVFVKFDASATAAAEFAKKVLLDIYGFAPDYQFRVRIN